MSIRIKDHESFIPAEFRKLFTDEDGLTLALADPKGIDPETRQLRFVASDDSIDLHDEIIAAGAFHELRDTYMANPCVLAGHQHRLSSGMTPVIGSVKDLRTEANPATGTMEFGRNAVGEDHWLAYRDGHQRAFSVGFYTRETQKREGRTVITKALLIEISGVPVPANSNALVLNHIASRIARYGTSPDRGLAAETEAAVRELGQQVAGLMREFKTIFGDPEEPVRKELSDEDEAAIRECLAAADKAWPNEGAKA